VPAVNVVDRKRASFGCCRTVYDDFIYRPHGVRWRLCICSGSLCRRVLRQK
jgi:hypothetical protein